MSLTEVHRVPPSNVLQKEMIARFVDEKYLRAHVPSGRVVKPLVMKPAIARPVLNPFANLSL